MTISAIKWLLKDSIRKTEVKNLSPDNANLFKGKDYRFANDFFNYLKSRGVEFELVGSILPEKYKSAVRRKYQQLAYLRKNNNVREWTNQQNRMLRPKKYEPRQYNDIDVLVKQFNEQSRNLVRILIDSAEQSKKINGWEVEYMLHDGGLYAEQITSYRFKISIPKTRTLIDFVVPAR